MDLIRQRSKIGGYAASLYEERFRTTSKRVGKGAQDIKDRKRLEARLAVEWNKRV